MKNACIILVISLICLSAPLQADDVTVALWLFDENTGLYPSGVISDFSENDYPLVLGLGGKLVPGKFGNGLSANVYGDLDIPDGEVLFGLTQLPAPEGRNEQPLSWYNADFCALMTSGENHLRKEVGFVNATDSKLNLGDFDWTVDFWFKMDRPSEEFGVIFELGQGPRNENEAITTD